MHIPSIILVRQMQLSGDQQFVAGLLKGPGCHAAYVIGSVYLQDNSPARVSVHD